MLLAFLVTYHLDGMKDGGLLNKPCGKYHGFSQKQLVHVIAPFHLSFVVTAKFYLNENAHLPLLSLPQVVVVPDRKTMEFFK